MIRFKSCLIEKYMQKHKLSKVQFANKCGISLYILNKVLDGQKPINVSSIIKICKFLDVSSDKFLCRDKKYWKTPPFKN